MAQKITIESDPPSKGRNMFPKLVAFRKPRVAKKIAIETIPQHMP